MSKKQVNISKKNTDNDKVINQNNDEEELLIKLINEIKNEKTRTKAIRNISKFTEKNGNLALYLWYSRGVMAIILQEIISSYQYLSSSKLTLEKSNKSCYSISLLQCIAYNKQIRHEFLESKIPIFLYPFLSNNNKGKAYEYLKLTSLSVINALLKIKDKEIIFFLIETSITPILLKIMEKGSELARKIACCIVSEIVQDDDGKKYICEEKERANAVIQHMKKMLKIRFSERIISRILKSFLKLSENKETRNMLKNELLKEKEINDPNFIQCLDDSSKKILNNLILILDENNNNIIKEPQKDLNNINNNNNMQNINIVNNINFKNDFNHQMNQANGNIIIQNNININMMMANQLNQMKMQPRIMIPPNYNEINYNIYNVNDNYMNNINYFNNQNHNNGFGNMNFYNIYKNS